MNQETSNNVVQATANDAITNGLDTMEYEEAIPSCVKSDSQENIATLDVTPEEINLSCNKWKHSSQHCLPQHVMEKNCTDEDIMERRRSETWTSGFSEKSQAIVTSNSLHNDNTVENSNFFVKTKQYYGSDINLHSGSIANHRNSIQRQSVSSSSDSHSGISDPNFVTCLPSDHASSNGKRASVASNYTSSNNSINCSFHHLNMSNNDESQSEFTDINLQSNGIDEYDCCDDNNVADDVISVETVKQTGKPNLGSFFDWISPAKNSSSSMPSSTKMVSSKELSTSVAIQSSTKNESGAKNLAKPQKKDKPLSTPNHPSNSIDNGKIPGIKSFGHTIKSTFSSKGRFWKNQAIEPLSTTALILEDRPRNLPTKSSVEAEKHRNEYEKMVENAKKHELRDIQKRKKHLKAQRKQEEAIVSISMAWANEILPNWNTMSQTSRTRQLWWQGLPPSVRGKVWRLAIGNELNITEDLYSIMVTRAHDKLRSMNETQSFGDETESLAADRECTVELIRLDISRTFPHLCIFQKGGPYHDLLHDILGAYASYRPDVGYVQGMSFMAAMLLLNMEPAEAFITFANLLNKPCQVAFFRLNEELMKTYFATFEVFFEENLPKLFAHFKQHNLTPDMYLIDWIFTMFSKALGLDTASRVWDMFCRDGEDFLFKTAIAILKLHEDALLRMEFIHAAQLLTRLPASSFTHQQLFHHVADVIMVSRGNRRWKDVLSLMKDAS